MSSTAVIESPSKSSTSNIRYHTNGIENEPSSSSSTTISLIPTTTTATTTTTAIPVSTTNHSNGNGVTAVVVTNPLASTSFSSTTSRYQSSVMNKYKNLATPDLTHPLSSLKQMTHILTNNNGNSASLDSHGYLASKYVCYYLIYLVLIRNKKLIKYEFDSLIFILRRNVTSI